jgi:hypothetical protein
MRSSSKLFRTIKSPGLGRPGLNGQKAGLGVGGCLQSAALLMSNGEPIFLRTLTDMRLLTTRRVTPTGTPRPITATGKT